MRRVSEEEFWALIRTLDVTPHVRGKYHDDDYGSDFVERGGALIGRTRKVGETPHYKPDAEYWLADGAA